MPLLTAKEVAQRLNVSPLTVFRLADSGSLPMVEVAKREKRRILRFRPEDLDKFITSNTSVVESSHETDAHPC